MGSVAVTSDHGGTSLKAAVVAFLRGRGCDVADLGTDSPDQPVHYPAYAKKLAAAITNGDVDWGVAICGTGIGMSIALNKFPGIRAALVWNDMTAKMAKAHNDANVICFGERVLSAAEACSCLESFLGESFEGGRHQIRLDMITEFEGRND